MRTIVISDIHGYYEEFLKLLNAVNFQVEKDQLFLLGDYVDKGNQSKEVVQHILQLSKHENVKVIGGNHDEMFLRWLDNQDYALSPYTNEKNAGFKTLLSFCPFYQKGQNEDEVREWIKEHFQEEIQFLRSLPDYIEDGHHIFVHAGINPSLDDWKQTSKKEFRWIREKFFRQPHVYEQTVIFGHTACPMLHNDGKQNFDVWFSERKIGIDGGAKFGGQLNALEICEGQYRSFSVKIKAK